MKSYRSSTAQTERPKLIPASAHLQPPGQQGTAAATVGSAVGGIETRRVSFARDFPRLNSLLSFSPSEKSSTLGAPVNSSWLRDPTPPSSPGAAAAHAGQPPVNNEGLFTIPVGGRTKNGRTICYLRKKYFLALLALIVIIVLAVAIGVGVGVGLKERSAASSLGTAGNNLSQSSASQTATVTSTASTAATRTITDATAKPQTTSSPPITDGSGLNCPSANGSVYNVPGSTARFLHLCGIDYSGNDGAKEIKHVPTDSMADCMKNCAGTQNCTGCGWGFIVGDTIYEHACWLKSDLQKSHDASSTWAFAKLL